VRRERQRCLSLPEVKNETKNATMVMCVVTTKDSEDTTTAFTPSRSAEDFALYPCHVDYVLKSLR
jgi:hypothetical protein